MSRVCEKTPGPSGNSRIADLCVAPPQRYAPVYRPRRRALTSTTLELPDSPKIAKLELLAPFNLLAAFVSWGMLGLALPPVFGADCNGNGTDDHADVTGGLSADCNVNDIPDECEGAPIELGLGPGTISVPALPRLVEEADLDGDSDLDLIHAGRNAGSTTLTVLLNVGERNFVATEEYALEGLVFSMAFGDFDADLDLDVVTANLEFILVLKNNGDGTFAVPERYNHPFSTQFVTVGDVDGDGGLDLLLENRDTTTISVLTNAGDGTFGDGTLDGRRELEVGDGPRAVAVGDFDGDGLLDIAAVNSNSEDLCVLLNRGGGDFQGAVHYPLGGQFPSDLRAVDLNDDLAPDLVAASGTSATVFLNMNDGKATFSDGASYPPVGFKVLATGDFNGDGSPDLALSMTSGSVVVRVNDGEGRFGVSTLMDQLVSFPTDVAAGDYDGDGKLDLAITSVNPNAVQVLWNGEGTSLSVTAETIDITTCRNAETSGCEPHAGVLADFNGDGYLDVVAAIARPGLLVLALNDGNGHLQVVGDHVFGGGLPVAAVAGDLDRDGNMDVVTADNARATLHANFGNGNGAFSTQAFAVGRGPFGVQLADLDGDEDLDAATANGGDGTFSVLFNDGTGMLLDRQNYVAGRPRGLEAVDLEGDGDVDLVVTDSAAIRVLLFLNEGGGTFTESQSYPLAAAANHLTAGDVNADGFEDIIASLTTVSTVSVLISTGTGELRSAVDYNTGHPPYSAVTVDFDGDGHLDLVTTSEARSTISILLGQSEGGQSLGTLGKPTIFPSGKAPRFTLPGDLDLDDDRDQDLVTIDRGGRTFTAFYNQSTEGADDVESLDKICTAVDFIELAAPASRSSAAELFVKYTLPWTEQAAIQSTLYQNTRLFELHQEFLKDFIPGLDVGLYNSLVAVKATRQYFVGTISRIRTDAGFIYGLSVYADWHDAEERLAAETVGEILAEMGASFRLEPLQYFPNSRDAVSVAEEWVDPGFDIFFDSGGRLSYEAYTQRVGYGRVRLMDRGPQEEGVEEFDQANECGGLSFRDILVFGFAPSDIEGVVGGVITAEPQVGGSHLSVRTNRRGTPNAYVKNALEVYRPFAGKLVRLEVKEASAVMAPALLAEAEDFRENNRPTLSETPTLDRDFDELSSLAAIAAMDSAEGGPPVEARFGGKATNLSRLQDVLTPGFEEYQELGFAIPVSYYLEFMRSNSMASALELSRQVTFEEYIEELLTHEEFQTSSTFRCHALENLRTHIEERSVIDPDLIERLGERIREVFPAERSRVRFRSSSNVEDAVEFNGAGLYDSTSVCVEDDLDLDDDGPSHCDAEKADERGIPRGLRKVWASLWNFRAFEERAFYQIDQTIAAMGILVNRAFVDERVNGVAFTGDPANPLERRYVISAQKGEESVVSPEPGIRAEKDVLDVQNGRVVAIERSIASTLVPPGQYVLSDDELRELGELMWHLDENFPIDPGNHPREDLLLDLEFKIEVTGELAVKQIRPFLLSETGPPPPTFELLIPEGTTACGIFDIGRHPDGVDALEEYELKSTVRLAAGGVSLPAGAGTFPAELVEELVIGPEREVATPTGPGEFSVERFSPVGGEIPYRFTYAQPFLLPGDRTVEFTLTIEARSRDGEPLEPLLVVDDERLIHEDLPTDGVQLQSTFEKDGALVNLLYSSCSHSTLPLFEVEAELADGTTIFLEERFREEPFRNFGAASLSRAEVVLEGKRREVSDYWDLVYAAVKHNLNVVYWVLLDPPVDLADLAAPVRVVELRSPVTTQEPPLEASARYLDENFGLLRQVDVVTFTKEEGSGRGLRFLRGDCNRDGRMNLSDAIFDVDFLFAGGQRPGCLEACDVNADGRHNISDLLGLLGHLFLAGPPPQAPFPHCGPGTDNGPGCERSGCD